MELGKLVLIVLTLLSLILSLFVYGFYIKNILLMVFTLTSLLILYVVTVIYMYIEYSLDKRAFIGSILIAIIMTIMVMITVNTCLQRLDMVLSN